MLKAIRNVKLVSPIVGKKSVSVKLSKAATEALAQSISDRVKGKTRILATSKQYLTYIKKYRAHLKLPDIKGPVGVDTILVPKEYFTDEQMADFVLDLGENLPHFLVSYLIMVFLSGISCSWMLSQKKSVMAALNEQLQFFGLPNIYDFPHDYRWCTQALQVKLSGHFL
jgi:hypothetical protein